MKYTNQFISGTVVTKEDILFSNDYVEAVIADLFPVEKNKGIESNNNKTIETGNTQLKTFSLLPVTTAGYKQAFERVKKDGYDGIEFETAALPDNNSFGNLLKQYGFPFIAQVHTCGETVSEHLESFRHSIEQSLPFNPVMINSYSGKDSWGTDEKNNFLMRALAFEAEIGIPVAHQIQRGRITYNPWDTMDFLLNFNELKLCCDFSEWVLVCNRLLHTEDDIIKLCAERCIHIHSRIGYQQGCLVPDPRKPKYAAHVQAHESWWNSIWQAQKRNGIKISTMTPVLTSAMSPVNRTEQQIYRVESQEICNWMKERQKKRFNQQ